MKKLINGIVDFRNNVQKGYREKWGRLATGQKPDTLFVACSDSRVVPNTFASTNPGDLFVLRNVGNIICPCGEGGLSASDESEAAAIEFAVLNLKVKDIIICGHSDCGAMHALVNGRQKIPTSNLKNWLRHSDKALETLNSGKTLSPKLEKHNQLSQLNVLLQLENVKSYPAVQQKLASKEISLHAWWFDIALADVYAYESELNRFVLIDEEQAKKIIAKLD